MTSAETPRHGLGSTHSEKKKKKQTVKAEAYITPGRVGGELRYLRDL